MNKQINTNLQLPPAFIERMSATLGEESEAFFHSYDSERAYGLRRNLLKLNQSDFETLLPFSLERVSWAQEGYYYPSTDRPGKHVFHEMGLYYIQEPSAMSVVEIADPQPGEVILDLCAAPGGKSTQIAGRLAGKGLLISNEIIPNRAKILSQNIERLGISNAVVLNHTPQELEQAFPSFFDRIIVDAPCSGEGMFHKEDAALTEWSPENVLMCADRQKEILSCAIPMLRPGGLLVYSTCTFAPAEDEEIVQWLLDSYPQLTLEPIDTAALGISEGTFPGTGRIYPHRQRGEGHFIARFCVKGERIPRPAYLPTPFVAMPDDTDSSDFVSISDCDSTSKITDANAKKNQKKIAKQNKHMQKKSGKKGAPPTVQSDIWKECEQFVTNTLTCPLYGKRQLFGDQLYLLPDAMTALQGLRVLRPGLHLGTSKKNRFEPSHALALALHPEDARQVCETTEPENFMRGMTFSCDPQLDGWTLITYRGMPLGWGKASRGIMKNHYPKGLRINW